MKASYFFIRTPIHYYNALEAKQHLCKNEKHILVVLSDYPPTIQQLAGIIDAGHWSTIYMPWKSQSPYTKFKTLNRVFNITRPILLWKILKIISNSDQIFWGNYNSIWLRYFLAQKKNNVIILDDGFAALSISKYIHKNKLLFNKSTGFSGLTERLFVTTSSHIELSRLTFFTSFKNISPLIDERATYTNYPFLKSQSRTDGPNQKTMYFIGQPLILLSILDKETYVRNINSIFEYYEKKGMKCFYVPHRSAIHNYIPKNWNTLYFNLPLEGLVFHDTQQLPKIMASFYSSALYYVNKFYQNKDMNFEYWEVNTLQSNSDIQHCYSYIKKEKLKNTIVHKLDA